MIALEPRIMFDGAAVATADASLPDTALTQDNGASAKDAQALLDAAATVNVPASPDTAPLPPLSDVESTLSQTSTGKIVDVQDLTLSMQAGNFAAPITMTDGGEAKPDQVPAAFPAAESAPVIVSQAVELRALDPLANGGKKEVAFIESNLADYQTLVDGVKPGVEVVLLDGSRDGLAQITQWAESHTGYDAIHVLSHGSEGALRLGRDTLNATALADASVRAELVRLGRALAEDGDLLLYGCNIAADVQGQRFVDSLAAATGADVAASEDLTGNTKLGGDWNLEYVAGGQNARPDHVVPGAGVTALDGNWRLETVVGNIDVETAKMTEYGHLLTAPATTGLDTDSVAWGGVGAGVRLDSGGDATAGDAENDAGNWNGSSLTVQRNGSAWSADVFSFDTTGLAFTVSGANLNRNSDSATFATFTNSNGVLTISFNANAGTALVGGVLRSVYYRNDTPTGDTVIRFSLSDGALDTTADVTVTSDSIYVTNTADTATIDVSNGVSFSEAVAIAAADATGSQTLVLNSAFATSGTTLVGNLAIGESLTVNTDAVTSGTTLAGNTITIASGYTLTFTNASGTTTVASLLDGAGGLTKAGTGTVTLNNAGNDYTGATTISAGILATAGGGGIGDTSAVTVASGATLSLGANETIGSLAGAGNVTLGSYTLTAGGDNSTTEFSGAIDGSGTLAKAGTGTLTLSGTNTFTGGVSISGGTLELKGGAALADTPAITFTGGTLLVSASEAVGGLSSSLGAGAISIASGVVLTAKPTSTSTFSGVISGAGGLTLDGSAVLTLSAANTFTGALIIGSSGATLTNASSIGGVTSIVFEGAGTLGTTTVNISSSASVTLNGTSGTITVGSGRTLTLSGVISGTGDLISAGTGSLVLSGANTFTGQLKINAGTTSISDAGNLGTGTAMIINNGVLSIGNDMTIAKDIGIGSSGATISTVKAVTLSGAISGSGSFTVGGSGTGGGVVTLTGANTMTGAINLTSTTTNGTMLVLTSASSVGATSGVTIAATGNTVALQGGITLSGIPFTLRGTGAKINSVSVGAIYSISGDNVINPGPGNATITMFTASTIGVAADSSLKLGSNVVVGSVGMTKNGAGTLTLAGSNNTYSGATTVSGGTFLLAGAITGVGSVTVGSGATLGGTGSITNGVSVVSGATLAPGVAGTNGGVGKLTIGGNLSLLGTLAINITGATGGGIDYDQVVVTGSVTLSSATPSSSALALSSTYSVLADQSFDLILKSGAIGISNKMSFGGSTVNEGGSLTANGTDYTLSYSGSSGNDLSLTATNARPAFTNLNSDSVTWAGVGNAVVLDASSNATPTWMRPTAAPVTGRAPASWWSGPAGRYRPTPSISTLPAPTSPSAATNCSRATAPLPPSPTAAAR